ncbi:type II toxin-antitoxin system HicA family toxin [Glycomyces sp. NPDC046736]|uniref:type II toxin-antitoxin system HicA family toxin n=1 Tax=Glycomyces sp. NPDC046736 TaxID=3155615 RepID=UPI0033D80A71
MKQRELLRALMKIAEDKDASLEFVRHGGSHDMYRILDQALFVPRHREIKEGTARAVIRQAEEA